jgi:hypothetical protein
MGDVAALFGELDHPLYGSIRKVQQGAVRRWGFRGFALGLLYRLCRHCSGQLHPRTSNELFRINEKTGRNESRYDHFPSLLQNKTLHHLILPYNT